ncbi:TPA: hypothetical protein IAC10_09175 [Candidatus Scatousia excrementigallinarum]|uniref:Uncharacterized protein n=1 Tax=Candidatus Scatousia excrementigallinarum TaxID=2840935 RepID=A0A9D1JN90_9BACT|nr:hypothetical protein [Candidatus Scatousia excrementigallinarum]
MRLFKRIILNIFKLLFCLYVTFDIPYTHYVFWEQEVTFQMKIYMFVLIILAISNWFVLFSKLKIEIKLALIIITILFGYTANIIPDVKHAFRVERCLDNGICD